MLRCVTLGLEIMQERLDEVRGDGTDHVVAHVLDLLGDVLPVQLIGRPAAQRVRLLLRPQQAASEGETKMSKPALVATMIAFAMSAAAAHPDKRI